MSAIEVCVRCGGPVDDYGQILCDSYFAKSPLAAKGGY